MNVRHGWVVSSDIDDECFGHSADHIVEVPEDTESRRLVEVVTQLLRRIREEGKRQIVRLLPVADLIDGFRKDGHDERVLGFELVVARGNVLYLLPTLPTVVIPLE